MGNSKARGKDEGETVQDGRRRHFFILDNAFIDQCGEAIGVYGIAVYALLARHADGNGLAFPGLKRIGEKLKISRSTVLRTLKTLEDAGMLKIERGEKSGTVNKYVLNDTADWKLATEGYQTDTPPVSVGNPPGVSQTPPPVSHRHPKEDPVEGQPNEGIMIDAREHLASSKEIADIIDVFVKGGYKIAFGNTTEREAANRIILTRGFVAAKIAAETAVQANKVPYAPKITKPSLLEDKWQELRDWYMRAQAEHKRKAPSVAIIS